MWCVLPGSTSRCTGSTSGPRPLTWLSAAPTHPRQAQASTRRPSRRLCIRSLTPPLQLHVSATWTATNNHYTPLRSATPDAGYPACVALHGAPPLSSTDIPQASMLLIPCPCQERLTPRHRCCPEKPRHAAVAAYQRTAGPSGHPPVAARRRRNSCAAASSPCRATSGRLGWLVAARARKVPPSRARHAQTSSGPWNDAERAS